MPASTTEQFAAAQGNKLLRDVSAQIARTTRFQGVREVHDLRVAIRRFLRILVVLKPCFPRSESRRVRRGLKRIMEQAGTVRDLDIVMTWLPKTTPPEASPLTQLFREKREEAAATLSSSLRRWTERNLQASWRLALKSRDCPGADIPFRSASIQASAKRILPDLAGEHFRFGRQAVREEASVGELHRFRIATRSLRYALDLFTPLYGKTLMGVIGRLKGLQDMLGDINDCATSRRLLSRQKGSKEILAALKKRQRKVTEKFRRQYAAGFLKSGNAAAIKILLSQAR